MYRAALFWLILGVVYSLLLLAWRHKQTPHVIGICTVWLWFYYDSDYYDYDLFSEIKNFPRISLSCWRALVMCVCNSALVCVYKSISETLMVCLLTHVFQVTCGYDRYSLLSAMHSMVFLNLFGLIQWRRRRQPRPVDFIPFSTFLFYFDFFGRVCVLTAHNIRQR